MKYPLYSARLRLGRTVFIVLLDHYLPPVPRSSRGSLASPSLTVTVTRSCVFAVLVKLSPSAARRVAGRRGGTQAVTFLRVPFSLRLLSDLPGGLVTGSTSQPQAEWPTVSPVIMITLRLSGPA
eukprot:354523-Rhodomonas_salina.4